MMSYSESDYKAMAAAAGYEIDFAFDEKIPYKGFEDDGDIIPWQPDTDPTDCFRLMVEADIGVWTSGSAIYAEHAFSDVKVKCVTLNIGKLAATMKAICDCAIAIGSQNGRGK